jgi:hypothetical protein
VLGGGQGDPATLVSIQVGCSSGASELFS